MKKPTEKKKKIHGNATKYAPLDYIGHILKNDLVFDVGANRGAMTREFVSLGAKVIAIEPQDDVKAAEYKDSIVLHICVSDYDGEVDFFIGDMSPLSSCNSKWNEIGPYSFPWQKVIKKKCRTLDSIIAEYGAPVYIKIDVEGYEDRVLNGLHVPVRYISLEYTQGQYEVFSRCLQSLDRLGFKSFVMCDCRRNDKKKKFRITTELNNVDQCMSEFNKMHENSAYRGDLLAIHDTEKD